MLQLQRSAGNRATVAAVTGASPAVQRLSVTAKDMQSQEGTKSALAGVFGRSVYAAIVSTVQDYEKAKKPEAKAKLLARLDGLCTKWFNDNADSKDPKDARRRAYVTRLIDELPTERAQLSKAMAQDIYMGNVKSSGTGAGGTDPGSKYALQALKGKQAGLSSPGKEGEELASTKGLSEAEVAAIRIFTASDYTYINPSTANSQSWLGAQKSKPELGLGDVSDRTLMEEGSLHAGVAMQGLNKLQPWTDDTYRGARYTEQEFKDTFMSGKPMVFNSFASSAQEEEVALKFEHGIGIEYKIAPDKDIAVLCVLSLTGGRDISQLSAVKKEKEVVLLPGTKFAITSVEEVDGPAKYPTMVKTATNLNQPLPKKWYVVHLTAIPKMPAPSPPTGSGGGG